MGKEAEEEAGMDCDSNNLNGKMSFYLRDEAFLKRKLASLGRKLS